MEILLKDKLKKSLFHGTLMDRADNIINKGFDFSKLNDRADFGKGFYVTDSYALAEKTATTRYYQELQEYGIASPPVIIRMKMSKLDLAKYTIKEFYGETIEWKQFICCNRWHDKIKASNLNYDHNIDGKYNITIGLTADGNMSRLGKLMKFDNYNLSNKVVSKVKPFTTEFVKKIGCSTRICSTKAYQIAFHDINLISSCIQYEHYDIIRLVKEDEYYE